MKVKIFMMIAIFLIVAGFCFFYFTQLRTFTVIFDSKGGTWPAAQEIRINGQVKKPEDPILSGYDFLGWYYLGEEYDFTTPVTHNLTLTAHWKEQEEK